jgi:cruciform cutting endonuclease 1
MSKLKGLFSLKTDALKSLCSAIGCTTTGTKAVLLEQLQHEIRVPKMPSLSGSPEKSTRVLSIDMGLKNLAFCVCDITVTGEPLKGASRSRKGFKGGFAASKAPLELSVMAWKRISVTESAMASPTNNVRPGNDDAARHPVLRTSHLENPKEEGPYTPRALSQTAYNLIKNLLPYKPDTILVERQRFRSGNQAAIQEWTVRVNMLEAMLWAVLETLKCEKTLLDESQTQKERTVGFPTVWDVSPKKVSNFWIVKPEGARRQEKVEKKQKIALVRQWIEDERSDVSEAPKLTFPEEALFMIDAFKVSKNGRVGKRAGHNVGKLDDLADCLLQAATWAKWEQNRRTLLPLVEEKDVEGIVEWAETMS